MDSLEIEVAEFVQDEVLLETDGCDHENLEHPLPTILAEDHPLLEKFQNALKDHLLRVQEQLLGEIAELDHIFKTTEQEREEVGCQLYDRQQELQRQNELLDKYSKEINETTEKRLKHEKNVEVLKKTYDERSLNYKQAKRRHNERLVELSTLQVLENNFEKWCKEIEDEVQTAKRVVRKDSQDQQMVSEEKKQMDLLLYNLDTEVRKREQELSNINEQIKEQDDFLNVLNRNLSDATSDLEVLQQEHKRLTQAWSEVIIAIQHRDKALFNVKENLRSNQEKYKIALSSIEAVKKEASKEMKQNEKLETIKARISDDIRNLERQVSKEQQKNLKLTNKLDQLKALLEQTEKDYKKSHTEGNALEVQLRSLKSKCDKLLAKKGDLEDQILELAKDHITSDKASEYGMKLMREAQDQRRNFELTLSQVEDNVSNVLLDLEKWKGIIIRLREDTDTLTKEYDKSKAKENEFTEDMKAIETAISLKLKAADQLSKKLDNLINSTGGQEQSPMDLKISGLERSVQEIEHKIRDEQNFWLVLQGHVVQLAEKRSAQMNEIQIARKQLMVIEQKTLKIDDELQETVATNKETTRNIQNLNTKIDLLGSKLFEKKKSQENDALECQHAHMDLLERLRSEEMSVLEMEQQIHDLTNEIERLKDQVLERHREALAWETKYKMAEEVNRWRNGEKSNESEIGCMKAEIHRMQIRYNQLKRAQEKLVQDLEHCVMHREKIFFTASHRQKIDGSQPKFRSTVQHKLNETKNKLKQAQSEISMVEKNLIDINQQYQQCFSEVTIKQDDIENERLQNNLIQAEIEQSMLLKHQNLENIVRKQHRAKRYRTLAASRNLPKIKAEAAIVLEMQKQKEINENLADIVQNLIGDFPEKKYFITRILQTLSGD